MTNDLGRKVYDATILCVLIAWILSLMVGTLFNIGLAAPWGFKNKTCFLLAPCDPNHAVVLPGKTLYFLPGEYGDVTLRMIGEKDRPARAESLIEYEAVMSHMTIDGSNIVIGGFLIKPLGVRGYSDVQETRHDR